MVHALAKPEQRLVMRKKCPYCDVEVNENRLERHKKKCLSRNCPYCLKKGNYIVYKKEKMVMCRFCCSYFQFIDNSMKPLEPPRQISKKGSGLKSNFGQRDVIQKEPKELDGSYGSNILRDPDGKFAANTSHDDYGEESDP
jgi:hypothetical protein